MTENCNLLVVQVESTTVGHADDLGVGGEGAAVQSAAAHHQPHAALVCSKFWSLFISKRKFKLGDFCTVDASQFDAGRGREEAVAPLAAAQARRFQDGRRVVVVEGVVARRVVAVHRHALEAVDHCHAYANNNFI